MYANTCSEWIKAMGTIIDNQIMYSKCMPTVITAPLCMKFLIDLAAPCCVCPTLHSPILAIIVLFIIILRQSTSRDHGFNYSTILGTLAAHAGADAVLYPAHYGSLPFEKSEEMAIRDALRSRNVFPVPSAGIHPGVVSRAIADYGNDVILNAGTGIMDHPSNPAAGVTAFFEALERVNKNQSFSIEEVPDSALKIALQKWMV